MAVLTGVAAQGFCAVTNSGAGCAELGLAITAVLEIIIYGSSVYNNDIERGVAHVSGRLGLDGGLQDANADGSGCSAST